ncbi:hypothetical protein M427DRAFT_137116 [Gonapodya prolifera JEL478]|uniref:BZIP domain-containing protein n=1 Tax=Gonapodya prolifera (strain JEL478) TaxID=1344416 RepID=A0A139A7D9_GONPJ|nr:hypothetical protein M427DRAFT_137116 [Gonapodya prolifera JEL478]|eukprot:KXS12588.1 hypothetical protein M427DRAFT_137116 [Gonapodya prolifera JEL478]
MSPAVTPKRFSRSTTTLDAVLARRSPPSASSEEDEEGLVPTSKLQAQREKNKAAQKAWRQRKRTELSTLRSSASESQQRLRDLEMENVQLRERNASLECQVLLVRELVQAQAQNGPRMAGAGATAVADIALHALLPRLDVDTSERSSEPARTATKTPISSAPFDTLHVPALSKYTDRDGPTEDPPTLNLAAWLDLSNVGAVYKALAW